MSDRQNIVKILEYIDKHINDKLTLNILASFCGYSNSQFAKLFVYYTGVSPMKYVSICKMIRANESLVSSDNKIIDIAFEQGYESPEVFERSFKRYFEVTPTQMKNSPCVCHNLFYLSENIYYERLRRCMQNIDSGN